MAKFSMILRKEHHDYEFVDLTAQVTDVRGKVIWTYEGRHHRKTEYTEADYRAIMNVMVNNAIASGDKATAKLRIDAVSIDI